MFRLFRRTLGEKNGLLWLRFCFLKSNLLITVNYKLVGILKSVKLAPMSKYFDFKKHLHYLTSDIMTIFVIRLFYSIQLRRSLYFDRFYYEGGDRHDPAGWFAGIFRVKIDFIYLLTVRLNVNRFNNIAWCDAFRAYFTVINSGNC